MSIDDRLDLLKDQIHESTIHTSPEKDDMADTLKLAREINGDDDLVRRSIKMMMINGIRRELRDPGRSMRIAEAAAEKIAARAIEVHVTNCPGQRAAPVITYKRGEGIRFTGDAARIFARLCAVAFIVILAIWWHNTYTSNKIRTILGVSASVSKPPTP